MPEKKNRKKTTPLRKVPKKRRRNSKKKKQSRPMPVWVRNLLAVLIALVFAALFYLFFIRPYAYRWKPCYGYKGYGVCLPYGYRVHGLDISHHQGAVCWEELARNKEGNFPLHFVFMKATEGGDLCDTTFSRNFESAHRHGLIRGAYHFFSPSTDAVKQAEFYIRNVDLKPGDLPPVLDIELLGKNTSCELQRKARTWLDKIEGHYGVKPIIYTSYKFKLKHLNDTCFNAYPYWIAHYYVDSVRYEGPWHFWQHSDLGKVPGISGKVDLNIFNGTIEELGNLTIPER